MALPSVAWQLHFPSSVAALHRRCTLKERACSMPLLPPDPDRFPADLFFGRGGESGADRVWRALHTKPRQEKSLARQLYAASIPYYLPLIRKRCLVHGRVAHSYVPLFPGYVFLLSNREERVLALATNRVVRALDVGDQQGLGNDLAQVSRLIASGAPVLPEDRLTPGARVRVLSGPLAGLEGKVIRAASGDRLVIQVDFIQRGASVVLDKDSLSGLAELAGVA
jgi:transcription antitermination factor NusG